MERKEERKGGKRIAKSGLAARRIFLEMLGNTRISTESAGAWLLRCSEWTILLKTSPHRGLQS